ncbi:hypothetical protein GGI19_000321 [Coemansia pectinata]|uniref:Uncharacterized protein n=1 Tax=Coemansia pectinata TaxID=1052879 RepID=A0A9W8H3T9_9FUNG|nr:hypothetical protein GGI19_000321 [Coemansia pectinata]
MFSMLAHRLDTCNVLTPLCRRMSSLAMDRGKSSRSYKLRTIEIHDRNGSYPVQVKETNMWTIDRVQELIKLVSENRSEFNLVDWQKVADRFPDRTPKACKTKYNLLMRDASAATSGTGKSMRKGGVYDLFSSESVGWSAEDDEMLLALFEVWGTKWDRISESIGKYTGTQCQGRYYWLRKKKMAKRGRAKSNSSGERKPEVPQLVSTQKRGRWSEAEGRKLRDLLIEHGRFDRSEAGKRLPGFSLAHIYYELDKALSGPGHASGTWTSAEHRALLELTKKHGRDWRSISLDMPTSRSATQCRLHYAYCCSGPVIKHRKWTTDEEERLRLLVDLSQQGKLKPSVAKHPAKDPHSQLSGIEEFSSADLSRFSTALRQDAQIPDTSPNVLVDRKNSVEWPLVSLYMMTHTVTQCRTKWAYMCRTKQALDCYRGPWTREEDARLYNLCQQAPNRWLWIMQRLVRPRGFAATKARYTSYIIRYVAMLRKCRGADWDPMADHFEEVHMRCEVRAWSRRQLEGYRPHDPYNCPHDMDLTGINNLTTTDVL